MTQTGTYPPPMRRLALVVDANADADAPSIAAFERAGWTARTATSRQAALTLLTEASYSALVLYPGRLAGTGFDVVAAVRRQCRALPIAVVLGSGRAPALADPRVLWFAQRQIDETVRHTVYAACRSTARATRRRDVRATIEVDPPAPPAPAPSASPAVRALRDLERVQLGAWVRTGGR